ncbi:lipoyl(octanoyl) transferase LipB [Teredinibacter haidensis]|uniref:lipoyl(octanoyl) transferase LipB n=1 Tax=Teredinibacter haidensis TaxID=2731755 RepID=UPI000948EB75|nr:lipoyl(octanoyl) transferase LipB [Teredinibacter haidensis]
MIPETLPSPFVIRHLGVQEYETVWREMREFTDARNSETADEIWLVQHPPVYTQGQAGKPEHLLNPQSVPVVASDRGGQVTYHGPGQLVVYPLLNLKRLTFGVRDLVTLLEEAVIQFLAGYGIEAAAKPDAPGVYVQGKKIASLGLRVRRGCSYHGLAINIAMDLKPFLNINPCGYQGLEMTQLSEWVSEDLQVGDIAEEFLQILVHTLTTQKQQLLPKEKK